MTCAVPHTQKKTKIAIAWASGFIGSKLIEEIFEIKEIKNQRHVEKRAQVGRAKALLVQGHLFSVLDIEKALKGCDVAVYLVHSMRPSAHLDQANFADYDLILADNFGKACEKEGVKHVLYLGGLMPKKANFQNTSQAV